MAARECALFLASAAILLAQGTTPRDAPADFPVNVALNDGFTLGAEYLVHSIPSPHGFYVIDDYLVVEVGMFGAKGAHLNVSADQFSLRLAGQKMPKEPIPPDAPGIVASGYTIGRMPDTPQSGGADDQMTIEQRLKRAAVPEGDQKPPFAGLLYFPFHGKMKAIKSMDLLYDGPAGKFELKLF